MIQVEQREKVEKKGEKKKGEPERPMGIRVKVARLRIALDKSDRDRRSDCNIKSWWDSNHMVFQAFAVRSTSIGIRTLSVSTYLHFIGFLLLAIFSVKPRNAVLSFFHPFLFVILRSVSARWKSALHTWTPKVNARSVPIFHPSF